MTSAHLWFLLALGVGSSAFASEASLTFEGRYEFRTDSESLDVLGKQVCFYPSAPTAASIPRPAGDQRLAWFCFANSEKAAHMLGFKLIKDAKSCGVVGDAKVTISNYKRYTGEGDGNDTAVLLAVSSKSPTKPVSCEEDD